MADKKPAKFYFDIDGLRYGARTLTIAEQAKFLVEVNRISNGLFDQWLSNKDNKDSQITAFSIQAAVYLGMVISSWPTDMTPINFLESDDIDLLMRYWEAYSTASEEFRSGRSSGTPSQGVVDGESPPKVVS